MSSPRRILIATVDFPPIEGGISTLTRETAHALADLGHEVTVLAPRLRDAGCGRSPDRATLTTEGLPPPSSPEESPSRVLPLPLGEGRGEGEQRTDPTQSSDAPEQSGITITTFPGYHLGILRLFPFLWAGLPLARSHDHILAINIAYGGVLGWLARTLFGTPYTTYAYAYEFLKFQRVPILSGLIRKLYKRAEWTVAISTFSRDQLADFGVPAESIVVAHPGTREPMPVTDEEKRALRHRLAIEDGPIILTVGRLIPRKRHLNLVHAFSRTLRSVPDAWLVIAGQGPEISSISRMALRLGIRDRVLLPGKVDDDTLAQLYAACTVFALPCGEDADGQVEGFGLVFTEANAHGKPVIGGRSGGVPDAVINGETGILVEPDDLEALTDALVLLLTDSALARRLGEQGKARNARVLSWEAFAQAAFGILPPESNSPNHTGNLPGD